MEKKNIDWENIGFGYIPTDKRFVANYTDGAWDEGGLTEDPNIVMNECAGVLQYAQTVFELSLIHISTVPHMPIKAVSSAIWQCLAELMFLASSSFTFPENDIRCV